MKSTLKLHGLPRGRIDIAGDRTENGALRVVVCDAG
jgi:hypothetical protein